MKHCILVAGMHRGGTSATMSGLHALRVTMGSDLMPGTKDNPQGYFEHRKIVEIHDELLNSLTRSWSDVRPLPIDWLNHPDTLVCRKRLKEIVYQDFNSAPLWALKDPRICRLFPLWPSILDELEISPCCIVVLRQPLEVSRSLRKRDGFSQRWSSLLWLAHMLEIERATRGTTRFFVEFDRFFTEPETAFAEIFSHFKIPLPATSMPRCWQGVFDRRLRNHIAVNGFESLGDLGPTISKTWQLLRNQVADDGATNELNDLYLTYHQHMLEYDEMLIDRVENLQVQLGLQAKALRTHQAALLEHRERIGRLNWLIQPCHLLAEWTRVFARDKKVARLKISKKGRTLVE